MSSHKAIIGIPIALIALLLIIGGIFLFRQQSIFAEDLIIYDSFDSNIFNNCASNIQGQKGCTGELWTGSFSKGSTYDIRNGQFFLQSSSAFEQGRIEEGNAQITSTKDFQNNDIRIRGRYQTDLGYNQHGSVQISYGGVVIFSKTINEKQSADQSFTVEVIRSAINPNEVTIIANGEEKGANIGSGKIEIQASGNMNVYIDEVQYRYYFNCQVDGDEVVVRDIFNEGTFSIKDLTYTPQKFCIDSYPAVVRSQTQEGVRADIRGEILRNLAAGKTITVKSGETVSVHYIADFKEGISERCTVDKAYDTKTRRCVKVVEEQPDIIEVIRDVIKINNQTVIRTVPIVVGGNDILFTGSINIGDKMISTGTPSFSCDTQSASAPDPRPDCWSVEVTSPFGSKTATWGEKTSLDNTFDIKYSGTANYDSGVVKNAKNIILLSLKNRDWLKPKIIEDSKSQEDKFYIPFNTKQKIKIQVSNSLANFQESGFKVVKTKDLITSQTSELIVVPFSEGTTEAEIELDTQQLGEVKYVIQPYVQFGNEKIFDDDVVVANYFIYDGVRPTTPITSVNAGYTPNKAISIVLIVSTLMLIGGVALLVWYKKNK